MLLWVCSFHFAKQAGEIFGSVIFSKKYVVEGFRIEIKEESPSIDMTEFGPQ
jgi:hypothetical protein